MQSKLAEKIEPRAFWSSDAPHINDGTSVRTGVLLVRFRPLVFLQFGECLVFARHAFQCLLTAQQFGRDRRSWQGDLSMCHDDAAGDERIYPR